MISDKPVSETLETDALARHLGMDSDGSYIKRPSFEAFWKMVNHAREKETELAKVKEYAQHKDECAITWPAGGGYCDCGLAELLK